MTTNTIRLVHGSAGPFKQLPVLIEIRPARIGWRVALAHEGLTGENRWWRLRRDRAQATVDALIGQHVRSGYLTATTPTPKSVRGES